jgi:hypothetical protein
MTFHRHGNNKRSEVISVRTTQAIAEKFRLLQTTWNVSQADVFERLVEGAKEEEVIVKKIMKFKPPQALPPPIGLQEPPHEECKGGRELTVLGYCPNCHMLTRLSKAGEAEAKDLSVQDLLLIGNAALVQANNLLT